MFKWRMSLCASLVLLFAIAKPMNQDTACNSNLDNSCYIQLLPNELKFRIFLELCQLYINEIFSTPDLIKQTCIDEMSSIPDFIKQFQIMISECSLRFSNRAFYIIFDEMKKHIACKMLVIYKLQKMDVLTRKIFFRLNCASNDIVAAGLILCSFLDESELVSSSYNVLKCCLQNSLMVISTTSDAQKNKRIELKAGGLDYHEVVVLIAHLKKSPENEITDSLFEKALALSIFKRKIKALHYLLMSQNDDKTNQLRLAILKGERGSIESLFDNSQALQVEFSANKWPLLIFAVIGRSKQAVKFLANKVNINDKNQLTGQYDDAQIDFESHAALHIAVIYGFSDMVNLLLKLNANVNITNGSGYTPLHLAVQYDRCDIINLLTNCNNVVIDSKDHLSMTPLHLAIINENALAVALLFASNADVNAKTKHQETCLHFLARYPNQEIAKLILSYKPYIIRNIYGETALDIASQTNESVFNLITEYANNLKYESLLSKFTGLNMQGYCCLS